MPNLIVVELSAPRWLPDAMVESVVRNPSWSDVDAALSALDGAERNDLYLSTPEEGTYLGVAGGPDLFVVALSVRNEHFAQAVGDAAVDGEVVLTVGGQPGRFARRSVVDAATARVAAEAYLRSTMPSDDVTWEWT